MKKAKIINKSDYYSLFPDDNKDKNNNTRYLALKEALDIRKFEIELYWKRTAFFWAFITVTYVALFNVLCKFLEQPYKYYIFRPIIIILSGLGVFFSVAWYLVNKGSKFWQKNWEKHVSLLEKDTIGPLYDIFSNPKTTGSIIKNPIEEYDFSVSKVNMCASILVTLLSLTVHIIIVFSLRNYVFSIYENIFMIIVIEGIIIITIIMFTKSKGNTDITIQDKVTDNESMGMIQVISN